jgi:hypothetical protein
LLFEARRIAGADWKNVRLRLNLNQRRELFPSLRVLKIAEVHVIEKRLRLCRRVLFRHALRDDEPP